MGFGKDVQQAIKEVNPHVGTKSGERVNNHMAPPEIVAEGERLWDAIGLALNSGGADYRRVLVYDGNEKASDPTQFHTNHFVPEAEMHPSTGTPEFDTIRQYEYGITVDQNVPVHTRINQYGQGTPPEDELTEIRDPYRLIIRDPKVKETSLIFPVFYAMPKNGETDLPADYKHRSPGRYDVLVRKNQIFEIVVEFTGCYYLEYIVYNGEVNKDSVPELITA